jgi:hypothetical protein
MLRPALLRRMRGIMLVCAMGGVSRAFVPLLALALLSSCTCSTASVEPDAGETPDAPAIVDAGSDAGIVAPYDTCAAPLDISSGGTFTLSMNEMHGDYERILGPLLCGGIVDFMSCRDAVAMFHLDEARDVDILTDPNSNDVHIALALLASCDASGAPLDTASGFGAMPLRHLALPPGTYFLFVGADPPNPPIYVAGTPPPVNDSGLVELSVTFGAPSAHPTNESCAAPLDLGSGGHFEGSFVDVTTDTMACGAYGGPELVHTFTLGAPANVHLTLQSTAIIDVVLRTTCGDGPYTDCFLMDIPSAGPRNTERTWYDLPAGTYFLTLTDWAHREANFTLDLDIGPATPPPDGEDCRVAIPIANDVPFNGTLVTLQEDFRVCGRPDAVHQFALSETSDVWIHARSSDRLGLSLMGSCVERSTDGLQCTTGIGFTSIYAPALAPGTYYIVAASYDSNAYQLTTEAWPTRELVPVSVTGNESCSTAYDVPAEGGVFIGDNTLATDDTASTMCTSYGAGKDVAFRWTTATRRRVFATTYGTSYGSLLELRDSFSCSELACDNRSAGHGSAALDLDLPPGTYTFVIDSYLGSNGPYRFELRPF